MDYELDRNLIKSKESTEYSLSRLDKKLTKEDDIQYILDRFYELLDICNSSVNVSQEIYDKYEEHVSALNIQLDDAKGSTPIGSFNYKDLFKFKEPIYHPTEAGLEHLGYDIDEKLYWYKCVNKELYSVFLLEKGEQLT